MRSLVSCCWVWSSFTVHIVHWL